jgi:hypothetical protein
MKGFKAESVRRRRKFQKNLTPLVPLDEAVFDTLVPFLLGQSQ